MYSKPISFLVGSTYIYGFYFIKCKSYHSSFFSFITLLLCNYGGIVVGLWIISKYLSGCEKYVLIVFIKLSWSNNSDMIIPNSICISFWRNMCMVSIKEEIISNIPFQSSGPFFGYINHFQKHLFWRYQGSLVYCSLTYIYWW